YSAEIWRRVQLDTQFHEKVGAALWAGLVLLGLGLKLLDRRWVIEDWLNRPIAETPGRVWDVVVPGPALAAVGFLMIIAGSIVGCFAYYPPPAEALEELNLAKTEALGGALSGHHEHALHWIPVCEGWTRRLQVGAYLRTGCLTDYARMKARVFRDKLELLEHMVEDHDPPDEIRSHTVACARAYTRLSTAFR
ncbi:MAG: hypothetical protein B7Z55_03555, partial [Planctomycetales bacterium 12-60-4]